MKPDRLFFIFRRVSLFFILALFPYFASATIGIFDFGAGVINKGSAGVGAAMPQDSLAAAINPAASAFLPCQKAADGKCLTNRVDAGGEMFNPNRGYSSSLPFPPPSGNVKSGRRWFFIPSLGYLHSNPASQFAYSVSIYGNGGVNTDYSESVFGAGATGINLAQAFTNLNFSWRAHPLTSAYKTNFSLGASMILALQDLAIKGVSSLSPNTPDFSNRGANYSFGVGARFGAMLKLGQFSFGASYQPEIAMSRLKKYQNALPNAGKLNIPPVGLMGIAYQALATLKFGLDIQHIWFSSVPTYSNTSSSRSFGQPGGPGFGWRDPTVFKFGVIWKALPMWILRAGYAYSTQVVRSRDVLFGILAPAVTQHHITLGSTYWINKQFSLSGNFLYAPETTVTGDQGKLTLHMYQFGFGLAAAYAF